MSYENIPNTKKVRKKFDLKQDVNATPLPNDIVELLRRNALKYTNTKAKRSHKQNDYT
jgi:hypothetical protein